MCCLVVVCARALYSNDKGSSSRDCELIEWTSVDISFSINGLLRSYYNVRVSETRDYCHMYLYAKLSQIK